MHDGRNSWTRSNFRVRGWPLLFLAGPMAGGLPARAEDLENTRVELHVGERLSVEVEKNGTVAIVRTRTDGSADRFEVGRGKAIVFEVSKRPPAFEEARVVRVLDGDTLVVDRDGREERVRLIGIDTPEIFGDFFSVEAWQKTRTLVEGKAVRLVYDEHRTDDLGRILAYVYVGKTHVNAELLEGGYARMPHRTDNVLLKEYSTLLALEEKAKAGRRGLWDDAAALRWAHSFSPESHYVTSGARSTFHRPNCPHALGLQEPKKVASIDAALAARHVPCTKCLPTRNYDPDD